MRSLHCTFCLALACVAFCLPAAVHAQSNRYIRLIGKHVDKITQLLGEQPTRSRTDDNTMPFYYEWPQHKIFAATSQEGMTKSLILPDASTWQKSLAKYGLSTKEVRPVKPKGMAYYELRGVKGLPPHWSCSWSEKSGQLSFVEEEPELPRKSARQQPHRMSRSTNAAVLKPVSTGSAMGLDFDAYEEFLGSPYQTMPSTEETNAETRCYKRAGFAQVILTRDSGQQASSGTGECVSEVTFAFRKGTVRDWKTALAKVGLSAEGVQTSSQGESIVLTNEAQHWEGAWTPEGVGSETARLELNPKPFAPYQELYQEPAGLTHDGIPDASMKSKAAEEIKTCYRAMAKGFKKKRVEEIHVFWASDYTTTQRFFALQHHAYRPVLGLAEAKNDLALVFRKGLDVTETYYPRTIQMEGNTATVDLLSYSRIWGGYEQVNETMGYPLYTCGNGHVVDVWRSEKGAWKLVSHRNKYVPSSPNHAAGPNEDTLDAEYEKADKNGYVIVP